MSVHVAPAPYVVFHLYSLWSLQINCDIGLACMVTELQPHIMVHCASSLQLLIISNTFLLMPPIFVYAVPTLCSLSWWGSCLFLHSPLHIGDDTQQHLKNITLEGVTLDVVCDVVVNFEHMKELQCTGISPPQEVWLLYTWVCIITVSCALKITRAPHVSIGYCFLPIFCWWSDQMLANCHL